MGLNYITEGFTNDAVYLKWEDGRPFPGPGVLLVEVDVGLDEK